jgi:RNA polymerase sigma-70 factor (ECF subfamily)
VVQRPLKALCEARPTSARQFFALACHQMRWKLNDLARRLDQQPNAVELGNDSVPAPASSDAGLSPDDSRIRAATERMPEDEHEAVDLTQIWGVSQAEAARVLGVSVMVHRRLGRGLQRLATTLGELYPGEQGLGAS